MPPPRKIDLIPVQLKQWLIEELEAEGFGNIVDVTERLNFRLEEEGLQITIGKSAVGEYSKAMKDQRDAVLIAETLLADMDIDSEAKMHQTLMQMIAANAVHFLVKSREANADLDPKALASLGKMLKDLMHSAGLREKLKEEERQRVAREVRENSAETAVVAARSAGLSDDQADEIKRQILGVG